MAFNDTRMEAGDSRPDDLIVQIVLNTVVDDARVLKCAASVTASGRPCRIYGLSRTAEPGHHTIHGIDIFQIANPRFSLPDWPKVRTIEDIEAFCQLAAHRIVDDLADTPPALLHTHDMHGLYVGSYCQGLLASRGIFIPWIHDVHEYIEGIDYMEEHYRELFQTFENDHVRQPDRLITVSDALADILQNKHRLYCRPTVILNCPRAGRSGQQDIRSSLGLAADRHIIVYSGNLQTSFRGAETTVEALAHLPGRFVFAIVSAETPITHALKETARKLGVLDRLFIHPYVPYDQVTAFLSSADIGCIPLLACLNHEVSLPNKLFEYMHAGLPVVVSDMRLMKDFVENSRIGRVFRSGNPEDLARAILEVEENGAEIKRAITEDLLREYSWETQEERLTSIYNTLLAKRRKRGADGSREASSPLDGCRIYHGPSSIAGQEMAIAEAERAIGLQSEHVRLFPATVMRYPAHRQILAHKTLTDWPNFARILHDYDIFHMYTRQMVYRDGKYLFPAGIDLLLARLIGKPTIMNFRGSEVRLASVFREKSPFHWLDESDHISRAFPDEDQRRIVDLCRTLCARIIVSDPEMQTYIPDATIVERALDLSKWPYVGPVNTKRPLVVHAPSRRLFKGTDYVLKAVDELQASGLEFDFQLVERMSNAEARTVLKSADIVVDQLRIGWYGVLAVESMALGKPVISYIREDLLGYFEGKPMPVVPATPITLTEVLRTYISDPQLRAEQGARGRDFAERVHDSLRIARKCKEIYESALATRSEVDAVALIRWFQTQELAGAVEKTRLAAHDPALRAREKELAKAKAAAAKLERNNQALRVKLENANRTPLMNLAWRRIRARLGRIRSGIQRSDK